MIMKRALTILSVSILAAAWLCGCGKIRKTESRDADVLYHACYSEPYVTLDPSAEQSNGIRILYNVYETLTHYDDKTGEVIPKLAVEWSSNADATKWVFKLRNDVQFHDGEKMNAEAVKKSIDRTIALNKGAAYIWDSVDSIEVTGEYEVTFHLRYGASIPLIASAGYAAYIMSPNAADKDTEWFNAGNDGGSGPYTIATVSARAVTLSSYEGYRGGWEDNQYKNVYIQEISDSGTRRRLLEAGEAQLTSELSAEDLAALSENDGVTILPADSFTNVILMLNTKSSPCSNADFRKALAYAFPYEEAVHDILQGNAAQSCGMIPKGLWGHQDNLTQYHCDLKKSAEYLEKSGLMDATVTVTFIVNDAVYREILQLYKENLAQIGVTLKLLNMDWDAQLALAKSPNPDDCQDILLMKWWPDYADPAGWFSPLLMSSGDSVGYNFCYLDDDIFGEKNRDAVRLTATNKNEAEKLYIEMQEEILDQCYMIFAYNTLQYYAVNNAIHGVYENPAYQTCVSYYDITKD
ncbi:ABC transporter substrate-binding protein [Enterocloster bolteae]|uniref:ABC transporter substrate-binding protein n=2 Tax=Enterocloster bolteae TaxID=208479 RepID=UPI001D084F13|nr:ABC transporter substrate-binding protein [Enterocloster bolteae]